MIKAIIGIVYIVCVFVLQTIGYCKATDGNGRQ